MFIDPIFLLFFAVKYNEISSSPQPPPLLALGAPQNSFILRPRFEVLTSPLNPLLPQGHGHLTVARHGPLRDYLCFRAALDTVLMQPLGETHLINTTDHPVYLRSTSLGEA